MEEFMLPCLNKQLFGVDCLGCGAQRAFVMVFQGKFTEAFHMFPAIYPILMLLLFVGANLFVEIKNAFRIKTGLIIISAAVIIINYYFKMRILF